MDDAMLKRFVCLTHRHAADRIATNKMLLFSNIFNVTPILFKPIQIKLIFIYSIILFFLFLLTLNLTRLLIGGTDQAKVNEGVTHTHARSNAHIHYN